MFFSIIIPTYNNCFLLEKTLNSLEKQSNKNFELIVVDNNSIDKTSDIVKKCSIKNLIYKKIINKGVIARSRNLGIEISKGDWLIFLDSDDLFFKDKIKFLNDNLTSEFDIFCNAEKIVNLDNGKTKIWKYGPYEKDFYRKILISGNRFSTSASVIKKDFLKKKNIKFNERTDFITAEDYDFFLNLTNNGAKVKFFDQILGEHSFHSRSQSSNYTLHRFAVYSVLKHHVFTVQKFTKKKEKLWKDLKYRFLLMDLVNSIKEKKYLNSFNFLIKLVFLSPFIILKFLFKKKIININFF